MYTPASKPRGLRINGKGFSPMDFPGFSCALGLRAASLLVLGCIVSALVPPSVSAEEGISITGKIVDENETPVREAVVIFSSSQTAQLKTISDAAGSFQIQIPSAGVYRIEAPSEGFFFSAEGGVHGGGRAPPQPPP